MARRKKKGDPAEAVIGIVVVVVGYLLVTGHARALFTFVLLLIVAFCVYHAFRKTRTKPPFDFENRSAPTTSSKPKWQSVARPVDDKTGRSDGRRPPTVSSAFPPAPTAWSLELIRSLEWKRFEVLCELLWIALGYTAKATSTGADGGVDINLYRPSQPEKLLAVVQCKSRIRENVGVSVVRELFGVMHHVNAPMGIVMTSSSFYPEAVTFAKGKHLQLVGGQQILERIRTLSDEKQLGLLAAVTAGDFLTPTCPSCDQKLLLRPRKPPKGEFWGCRNFPACRYTQVVRKSL